MPNITVVLGADDVSDVLLAWSAAGLVSPFLWWEGEKAGRHWVRHSHPDAEPVPLLDALAAARYDRVRLLCLQTLTADGSTAESVGVSLRVKDLIERHLGRGQRLSTVGVLVPATGVTDVPGSVLSNRWDTIAIAVDQDGVDLHHSSREIHSAEDLAAHAALTVATVGGLWPGMADAPFDDDVAGAGHQEPRVRLVRTHARGVRGDGLAGQIVRTTLSRRRNPEWTAVRANALLAPDPDRTVESAATEYLAGPGARLRRTPHRGLPYRAVRFSSSQTLRLLGLFVRGRIDELREELHSKVPARFDGPLERFVERLEVDPETGAVLKLDDQEPAPEKLVNLAITKGTVDLAIALRTEIAKPAAPGGFAAEWKALRQLSFGLADAGPLGDGLTEPASGAHRLVVTAPSISPPPAEPERSLRHWHQERPGSLLSRVGTRLHDDAGAARVAFLGALTRLREARQPLSASFGSFKLTKFLWRSWMLFAVAAAVVAVGALVTGMTGALDWPAAIVLSGEAIVGFLVASLLIMTWEIRTRLDEARRINRFTMDYEDAAKAAEHEAAELIRLTAACGEYPEVAVAIAIVTHTGSDKVATPEPAPVDLAALPRPWAFGVAGTEIDPATLARLASIVGGRCFGTGWISALYADTAAKSMSSLKFDRGLSRTDPRPDPDADPAARRVLCADLRKGAARELLLDGIHALVVDELPGHGLDELFPSVWPVGGEQTSAVRFFTGLRTTTASGEWTFNSRYWNGASGYRAVATSTRIWLPEALGPEHIADATPIAELDLGADPVIAHSARLDTTPPIVWSDLAMFACDPPEEEPSAATVLGDIG